ncbi:hypothetical protein HQ602_17470 [Rhodococcus kroppenstedtii]|uniref:hypothetical protein n=1 Tax=Rhodococcoides kroppenstedtii TaxID=293050 RepID=UPI001C9AA6BA|nr:hypothetical protein [Rhodococcus kroppenstedtii]MBY6438165.1 hypothetical protein [Rhodococcus kroppenstedtii]
MATDNHHSGGASLFPDPQESFARIGTPVFPPVATSGRPDRTATSPAAPPATGTDWFVDDTDGFVDDTVDAPLDLGADDDAAAQPTDVPRAHPLADLDGDTPPLWVRTHVPADPLVRTAPTRRFRRARPDRPAPGIPVDADSTAEALDPAELADTRSTPSSAAARRRRRGVVAVGVAAAVVVLSGVGAAAALSSSGDTASTAAAPPPEPSVTAASPSSTTTTVAAPWCTEQSTPDAVTTSAAGDRSSAAGVIAAFEHAYYVQRSAAAVAELMVSPAPEASIQAAIDRTPAGTEHCVTITPADAPGVSAVALTLRTPSGSESAIASRITTARTDQSYAISSIEEIR